MTMSTILYLHGWLFLVEITAWLAIDIARELREMQRAKADWPRARVL